MCTNKMMNIVNVQTNNKFHLGIGLKLRQIRLHQEPSSEEEDGGDTTSGRRWRRRQRLQTAKEEQQTLVSKIEIGWGVEDSINDSIKDGDVEKVDETSSSSNGNNGVRKGVGR